MATKTTFHRHGALYIPSSPSFFLLVLLIAVLTLLHRANAQTDLVSYCGTKPCIEAFRMPCEKLMEIYEFQGSCCSMEDIPASGGCRVTVAFGNCFWYPFCGECTPADKVDYKCHTIFETDANLECPAGDYDPVKIQNDILWERPTCSPTMSPTEEPEFESSALATSIHRGGTFLAAILGTAMMAA